MIPHSSYAPKAWKGMAAALEPPVKEQGRAEGCRAASCGGCWIAECRATARTLRNFPSTPTLVISASACR